MLFWCQAYYDQAPRQEPSAPTHYYADSETYFREIAAGCPSPMMESRIIDMRLYMHVASLPMCPFIDAYLPLWRYFTHRTKAPEKKTNDEFRTILGAGLG